VIRATISTVKPLPPLEQAGDQPVHVPEHPSLSASTVVCFPAKTGSSLCKFLGRLRYKHLRSSSRSMSIENCIERPKPSI
jgi:hypothetical protein